MAQGKPSGSAIQGLGVLILFAGAWLLYATVTNQAPIKTLVAIVKDPGNARSTLSARTNKISNGPLTGVLANGNQAADFTGAASGNGQAAAIVAFARAQIGKPYQSPGDSINTWDCSGLTKAAVKAGTGIDLVHGATSQSLDPRGKGVARKDLQAGDIVFPSIGHCGVMTGNNTVVHAPYPGRVVDEQPLWAFISAKRFWNDSPTATQEA